MAQPPLGTVDPTKLYVDRASRQIWFGVDVSVDPTGSILVSDIAAMLAYADQSEADANAYTDTQIATRAPTSHTHTASQVTDFTAAVQAVIAATPAASIPSGMIAMYSGSMANIGVGAWAGWHLCDGTAGTPNLSDKFIMGAGNVVPGTANAAANFDVDGAGAHSHGGVTAAHTLNTTEMPAHTHGSGTLGGTALSSGAHTHDLSNEVNKLTNVGAGGPGAVWTVAGGNAIAPQNIGIASGGAHTHTLDVNSGATASAGLGAGHTHPISAEANHVHTVTAVSNRVRNALNWFALAYVMKL